MRAATTWCVVMLAVACGGSDVDPTGTTATLDCASDYDTYADGLTAAGQAYEVTFLAATPQPPDRGENTWSLQVAPVGGVATTDVSVAVEPFMPEHGHGTSPETFAAEVVDGAFDVGPIDLFMPGLWVLTFYVDDGQVVDAVEFRFCLEG